VSPHESRGCLMPGLPRERPGLDTVMPCTGDPAVDLGDGIWMSPGLSNSYLVTTDDGPVVINTGMGFEGRLHRGAFEHVDGDPQAIILTQGHYDHVGGLHAFLADGVDV